MIERLVAAFAEPFSPTHQIVTAFLAGLACGLLIAGGGTVL